MSSNPNLRNFINAVDLNEASLSSVASSVADKVTSALGNKGAEGREQSRALARYLDKQYQQYLGQLQEKDPSAESIMKYLVSRIGFTAENARKILGAADIDDATKTDDPRPVNKASVSKAFEQAAIFAYKHDLVPKDKDAEIKRQQTNGKRDSEGFSSKRRDGKKEPSPEDRIRAGTEDAQKDIEAMSYRVDKTTMTTELKKAGLSQVYVNDVHDIVVDAKNFSELAGRPDRNELLTQLAKVGYAFLRSQGERK